ncbi:MAG: hypothetical protein WA268_13280 [Xanthobacteraceae bacterium]
MATIPKTPDEIVPPFEMPPANVSDLPVPLLLTQIPYWPSVIVLLLVMPPD